MPRFGHLSYLVFSELHTSVVWYQILICKNSQSLLYQQLVSSFLLFLLLLILPLGMLFLCSCPGVLVCILLWVVVGFSLSVCLCARARTHVFSVFIFQFGRFLLICPKAQRIMPQLCPTNQSDHQKCSLFVFFFNISFCFVLFFSLRFPPLYLQHPSVLTCCLL